MRIPGLGKLQQRVQQIQKRLASSKGLILMYHRVAEAELDTWGLCVTPQHFAEHLEVLQKYAHPISLPQLAQAHREGNIPHQSVALTFDDGYADNFYNAKPLLERYNIPATVFVTTGYIGHNREFWWDELERLLLNPGRLPEKLCLTLNGNTYQWELGEATYYSEENYQCDRERRAWEGQPGSRFALYYSVWKQLQPLPRVQRQEALDEILIWAGTGAVAHPTYRPLQFEELPTLAQGELVEIGAHTVTHPFLPAHSATIQQDEIQRSKDYLEEVLHRPVTSFAYPFGGYAAETVELIQEAGFACACSTIQDIVWRRSNCFELPRFEVQNWNGEEFARWLSRWFHS